MIRAVADLVFLSCGMINNRPGRSAADVVSVFICGHWHTSALPESVSLPPFRKAAWLFGEKLWTDFISFPLSPPKQQVSNELGFGLQANLKKKEESESAPPSNCQRLAKDVSADSTVEEPGVVLLSRRPRASPIPAAVVSPARTFGFAAAAPIPRLVLAAPLPTRRERELVQKAGSRRSASIWIMPLTSAQS